MHSKALSPNSNDHKFARRSQIAGIYAASSIILQYQYKTRSVSGSVCVQTPPPLTGRRASIFIMAENATFLSVCADESQAGNPIGSALVHVIEKISWSYLDI